MKLQLSCEEISMANGGGTLTCSCGNPYLRAAANFFAVSGAMATFMVANFENAATVAPADISPAVAFNMRRKFFWRVFVLSFSSIIAGGIAAAAELKIRLNRCACSDNTDT